MKCFKPAWDKGFTTERNLKGWRIERQIPFNRNALWEKIETMSRSYTGHSAIGQLRAANSTPAAHLTPETPRHTFQQSQLLHQLQ